MQIPSLEIGLITSIFVELQCGQLFIHGQYGWFVFLNGLLDCHIGEVDLVLLLISCENKVGDKNNW